MKDLRAIRGTFYIASLIEQGEHEHQDFKYSVSDARKIARTVSAFANNSGGHLLIGVRDNGSIAGVRNEEDIYVVEHAAQGICSPSQPIKVDAFKVDGGLKVLRVEIAEAKTKPVMVREDDNSLRAFYRVADENILATPLMVRAWKARSSRPLTFNPAEKALLEMLSPSEPLVPAAFFTRAHVSQALGEAAIINLCAMGLARVIPHQGADAVIAIPG